MPSGKQSKKRRGLLIYVQGPQNVSPDRVHVELANLGDKTEDALYFIRRWGWRKGGIVERQGELGMGHRILETMSDEDQAREVLASRNQLRTLWRMGRKATIGTSGHPAITFKFTPGRIELEFDELSHVAFLMFWRDFIAGRTAICANENCPNPYFIRTRKSNIFCESGPCLDASRRASKLKWWHENRGKGSK